MGLRARALLYRYSRTASEDRASVLRCCLSTRKMGLRPVLQVTVMNLHSGLPRWRPEADSPCCGARSHRRAARPRRTVLRCYAAVSPPVKWVCDPFAGDGDEPPFGLAAMEARSRYTVLRCRRHRRARPREDRATVGLLSEPKTRSTIDGSAPRSRAGRSAIA